MNRFDYKAIRNMESCYYFSAMTLRCRPQLTIRVGKLIGVNSSDSEITDNTLLTIEDRNGERITIRAAHVSLTQEGIMAKLKRAIDDITYKQRAAIDENIRAMEAEFNEMVMSLRNKYTNVTIEGTIDG